MLAVSPLRSERNERESDGLLESIDFDEIFAGIDVMPDSEMDCETLADFSGSDSVSDVTLESPSGILVKTEDPEPVSGSEPAAKNPDSKEALRSRKNPAGKKKKKKAKVDWTPELHRRFVTAVDQLGIDKAVPSRILEIMGIDCLTRHNIASHLQKYRSHRKHLLAREAEAASWSWSRRRQMYGSAAAQTDLNPWIVPTMGFPPVVAPPVSHVRPLHVWGHPLVDQSLMYTCHKHIAPPPSPLADPSFWQYIFSPPAAQKLLQSPSDVHPSNESIDAAIGDVLAKPWLPLPLGLKPPSISGVMVELQRLGVSKIPPT